MKRRELLLLGGAITAARALRAQQKPMPAIGILGAALPEAKQVQLNLAAFRQGLGKFGYVEGQNVAIEYRWAESAASIGCPHWPPISSAGRRNNGYGDVNGVNAFIAILYHIGPDLSIWNGPISN